MTTLSRIASVFVPVAAVALSIAGASHAGVPYRGDVLGYTSNVTSTTIVLTVSGDNNFSFAPASLTGHIAFTGSEVREGDTGTARFKMTWEPDSEAQTSALKVGAASFAVDKNGSFNGNVAGGISWASKSPAFAFWCPRTRPNRYSIPGQVQVTVDNLTGTGTANPRPTPITLDVRCLPAPIVAPSVFSK